MGSINVKFRECQDSNLGQLGPEARTLTTVLWCPPSWIILANERHSSLEDPLAAGCTWDATHCNVLHCLQEVGKGNIRSRDSDIWSLALPLKPPHVTKDSSLGISRNYINQSQRIGEITTPLLAIFAFKWNVILWSQLIGSPVIAVKFVVSGFRAR